MGHTILGVLIFVLTLGTIIVRPYRISEALSAGVGAVLMLIGGFVRPGEAFQVLGSNWNIYGFFLGLMTISALAEHAHIFDVLAAQTGRLAKGSARRLFVGVFLAGVLVTAFLSNDAAALILTPVVYALVTRLRLPALPYMFACTFIADTASFLLPVSNPINVLILDHFGGGLGTFWRYLLLPALFCVALNVTIFLFLFRVDLRNAYQLADLPSAEIPNRAHFRFTVFVLAVIAVAFVLASSFQAPLSLVALAGAAVLLSGAWRYKALAWGALRRDISWSLFVFVSGMFLVIRSIENLGLTNQLGVALVRLSGANPLPATLLTAAGAALGANLINNVPMALVMISALGSSHPAHPGLVYAAILGCDLGPNLTTVGSLATILWLLLLRRKGLEVSALEYFKLGIVVVPVMVVVGAVLIASGW